MACLSDETIAAFAQGTLLAHQRNLAEQHIDGCPECAEVVAELAMLMPEEASIDTDEEDADQAATHDAADSVNHPLVAGTAVSRYIVTRVVGSGSGGVVYEAYDPQLRRRASLKLIRPTAAGGVSPEEFQRRMLREAQAMARLSHPNVVAVHDAGLFDGQIYIVLEFAEGETLTAWMGRARRGWREIVEVFTTVGRGLAAAHAAQIVHRDFKPDNVIVGGDGRVRLTDFGLARPVGVSSPASPAGTPAFMAPEQFDGVVDARTDQFAFCVALHWALFGRHPFRRRSDPHPGAAELGASDVAAVPDAVRVALARGLQLDPKARFASMDDLLAALTAAPAVSATDAGTGMRPPRRRPILWAAAALALGASASFGIGLYRRASTARHEAARVVGEGTTTYVGRPPSSCAQTVAQFGGAEDVTAVLGGGGCFRKNDEPTDWRSAAEACSLRGGHLAVCSSSRDCAGLASSGAPDQRYWIGLGRGHLGAITGVTDVEVPPSVAREFLRPIDAGTLLPGHDCVALEPSTPKDRRRSWSFQNCAAPLSYICQSPFWITDPSSGHAYRVFHRAAPWSEAVDNCKRIGARLVTISSDAEETFIEANFRFVAPYDNFWIGASDHEHEGTFVWATGEPFGFTAFSRGEPNAGDGDQDCLVLNRTTLRWHDRQCDLKYAALCESASAPVGRPR